MFEHEIDRCWKTVVNSIQDGLMIVDCRGVIVSVNKALEKRRFTPSASASAGRSLR